MQLIPKAILIIQELTLGRIRYGWSLFGSISEKSGENKLLTTSNQFVKNCTTRRSSDCLEDIARTMFIGKSRLACQESCGEQSVATRLPLRGVERLRAVNGQSGTNPITSCLPTILYRTMVPRRTRR